VERTLVKISNPKSVTNHYLFEMDFKFRHMHPGMKVERKLSDFFVEKRKQNENVKTKTEICRTETETEFF
jgi:hypothetical protein